MRRRAVLIGAALMAASVACAQSQPAATNGTFVRLAPTASGYAIRVDEEAATLDDLDAVVFRHASAANPHLPHEKVRESALIFLAGQPGVPFEAPAEVLGALSGFKRIGVVGEDRRR